MAMKLVTYHSSRLSFKCSGIVFRLYFHPLDDNIVNTIVRKLDFIRNNDNSSDRKGTPPSPEFSVPATDQSLNIMKAGCQSRLLHRVPPGTESGVRYSLSFRNLADPLSTSTSSPPSPHHPSTPPQYYRTHMLPLSGVDFNDWLISPISPL